MIGHCLVAKCLASGSSGNVYLIRSGETAILVDCGLPARAIEGFLKLQHVDPRSLQAILVTHEHSDHIQSVGTMSRRYGIPVIANVPTIEAIRRQSGEITPRILATGSTVSLGDLEITSFPTSHDSAEPVGYLVCRGEARVCILTDTGTVLPFQREMVSLSDLVILESNHDHGLLTAGPYPEHLKNRIRSDKGHLSNVQAAHLIAEAHRSQPQTVWLAHLSDVNNNPTRARRTVSSFLAREGVKGVRLKVALRDRPSLAWRSDNIGWQLPLL
ncbi:MAG: MBL fold metallo-hydrolase [Dehalococcoidia bacterium]|nr:MBL fold metallo-hydrolase [Dehalococcoidia bacterium]